MDRGQQQVWMHLATSAVPDVVLAVTSETLKKFAKKFGRAGKWHLGILSRHSSGSWRSQAHGPELRHLIRLMHVAVIGRLPGAKPPKQNREYISRQRVAKNIWLKDYQHIIWRQAMTSSKLTGVSAMPKMLINLFLKIMVIKDH